jgi:hypothetical protein
MIVGIIFLILIIGLAFVFYRIYKKLTAKCPSDWQDIGVSCLKPGFTSTPEPGVCPEEQQMEAGLCYQKPKPEHKCVATICGKDCPKGWRDDGLYCAKPDYYDRGAGQVKDPKCSEDRELWGGLCYTAKYDRENWFRTASCTIQHKTEKVAGIFPKLWTDCEKFGNSIIPEYNCPPDKEDIGGLCYTKPKKGYKCVVTACQNECPKDWEDIGVSCKKPTYDRGIGKIPECSKEQEKLGLLCYKKCPKDHERTLLDCRKPCTEGLRDDGLFCAKPALSLLGF